MYIKIEEDLGYVISAETLPVLRKVKHFVNYINQVEQFKVENHKAPLPWVKIINSIIIIKN